MERRFQQRAVSQRFRVEISDGLQSYDGVVANLTYTGVAIEGLPLKINFSSPFCMLVIHGKTKSYKLRAVSLWSSINDKYLSIGAKIYEVPRSWYRFVDSLYE